jgi:hypothetical protein
VDANAEEEDLILSTMPLLVPLLLSRKKRVRSTALFTTEESTFDLLMMSMFSLFSSRRVSVLVRILIRIRVV